MVNYRRDLVEDTKHRLEDTLAPYNGTRMSKDLADKIVSEITHCIKDLSWDEFSVLRKESPAHLLNFLDDARSICKERERNRQASQAGVKLPSVTNETDEERNERLHKEQLGFFFKKNPSAMNCNCGAAYTSFPNIHMEYCSANKKEILEKECPNFWD